MIARRGFIGGLLGVLSAPAIVQTQEQPVELRAYPLERDGAAEWYSKVIADFSGRIGPNGVISSWVDNGTLLVTLAA